MEYYVNVSIIYLLIVAYLVWRVRSDLKHKRPLGQTATWLIYMIPYGVIGVIGWVTPEWPQFLKIGTLVVWILVCAVVSYKVHSKYNAWLDKEREREKFDR